jgi:hypothetical protein
MQRNTLITLIATGLATIPVVWLLPSASVDAGGGGTSVATQDTDDDFLPDAVEWVVLTNANLADTDGDQTPDFVEVVEAGLPRHESSPLPPDQQMRCVVTGPQPGSGDVRTWMHVFHRVMTPSTGSGAGASAIQSFETWLEGPMWPGVRFPLNALAAGGVVYDERVTQSDGIWVQVSIPMVSEAILAAVAPCTIWAETVVQGETLRSGTKIINVPGGVASIVPYLPGQFVIQSLSPVAPTPGSSSSNRVCVLELEELSSGPSGITYQVIDADCEDANELECDSTCQSSIGWTMTIPGGTEMIGGQ